MAGSSRDLLAEAAAALVTGAAAVGGKLAKALGTAFKRVRGVYPQPHKVAAAAS